jgi:hypothetical protein
MVGLPKPAIWHSPAFIGFNIHNASYSNWFGSMGSSPLSGQIARAV